VIKQSLDFTHHAAGGLHRGYPGMPINWGDRYFQSSHQPAFAAPRFGTENRLDQDGLLAGIEIAYGGGSIVGQASGRGLLQAARRYPAGPDPGSVPDSNVRSISRLTVFHFTADLGQVLGSGQAALNTRVTCSSITSAETPGIPR